MTAVCRFLVGLAGLACLDAWSAVAAADAGPAGRFQLITADEPRRLERRLDEAAVAGYRVLAAAQGVSLTGKQRIVALLERVEVDGDYGYAVVSLSGAFGDAQRETVNNLAAEGYRLSPGFLFARNLADWWLPENAYDDQILLIMERPPTAEPFAYEAIKYGSPKTLNADLLDYGSQGYGFLALWNSARRLRFVLEAPGNGRASAERAPPGDYRLLIDATGRGITNRINRAAKDGFRVAAATDQTIIGPPIVLLDRASDPGEEIEYKFLRRPDKKIGKGKLGKKLNKRTHKGFRVTRTGITPRALLLERSSKGRDREYLTLSSAQAPGLPRALEQATEQGFRYMTMFVASDETTVLLERKLGE